MNIESHPVSRRTIQLLFVEDDPADTELIVDKLMSSGFSPEWRRVETQADFARELRPDLDLVVSDYQLPSFSGMGALAILQDTGWAIPFIMVTGTLGEEAAVRLMRGGATDYVLKDRLERLPAVIERALRERDARRERQRIVGALRASEERFRVTLDRLMEGCQIISRDWRYVYLNEIAARQGNRTVQELLGESMTEAFPGIEQTAVFNTLRTCMEDRVARTVENEFVHEGSARWFQLLIQPVPEGLFILSLDITARKLAEAEVAVQLSELQRWHGVMLGREERIMTLKREVNVLLGLVGQPPRYKENQA